MTIHLRWLMMLVLMRGDPRVATRISHEMNCCVQAETDTQTDPSDDCISKEYLVYVLQQAHPVVVLPAYFKS